MYYRTPLASILLNLTGQIRRANSGINCTRILGFNSPCEFGFPIFLWVAAQFGVLKDFNNQVSKWRDLSLNSRDFVQDTALQQPIYEVNGINGLPSIRTSSAQGMRMSSICAAPCSVFYVARMTGGSSYSILYDGFGYWYLGWANGNMNFFRDGEGATLTGVGITKLADTNPYLYTAIQNGIDSSVYCNGALIAYSSVYKRGPDSYGLYFGGSNAMISEIVVYKAGLSREQRLQVEAYFQIKYALWKTSCPLNSNGSSILSGCICTLSFNGSLPIYTAIRNASVWSFFNKQ